MAVFCAPVVLNKESSETVGRVVSVVVLSWSA